MSCWRRRTVLRIPALFLGFEYWGEWDRFCYEHDREFRWAPGRFAPALCESYPYEEYHKLLPPEGRPCEEWDRLDMDLYPGTVKTVPGPFLDYCLEDICPLRPEDNTLNRTDVARPLTPEEKEKYLPLFRKLFPDFTMEQMEYVHYCRYEWYDGSDAGYMY